MKKKYLFLLFTLLLNTLLFSQTVTLTPTGVNNSNVNSGPINLASVSNSTVTLVAKVQIPNNATAADNGTVKIYYSNLSVVNANIAAGGDGGSVYFGGGSVGIANFTINLYWSDFLTSGGFIYAEYKTASNTTYRSSNLAVIKNATMTGGTTLNPPAGAPNPSNISNTICCNQTIRLGDKPQPITGSQYSNPYKNEPYGINESWETNGNPTGSISSLDNTNKTLNLDYITQTGNFTVKRSLGYNYGSGTSNKSNSITITVVPSPILSNNIGPSGGSTDLQGFYELSSLKSMIISGNDPKVNLNILANPNHTAQRGDNLVNVESYRWEYKDYKYNSNPWITVSNQSSSSFEFSDPSQLSNTEDTYYLVRRIAVYQNILRASEEVKIVVRGIRSNNTICCDQTLKIFSETNFETPTTINGSEPIIDNSGITGTNFSINSTEFQWQVQSLGRTSSQWANISGATYKDYTPNQSFTVTSSGRRGSSYGFENNYRYRRIVKSNYRVYNNGWIYGTLTSYSNETQIDGSYNEPAISIYPNPTSTTLNIQSVLNLTNSQITISNVSGNILNSNNFSILNSNLLSVDVSNFTTGTYFIKIEAPYLGTIQKTFIKQ